MSSPATFRVLAVALTAAALALAACTPTDGGPVGDTPTPTGRYTGAVSPSPVPTCDRTRLGLREPGTLTIATDLPGQLPWLSPDPTEGEGFEGEIVYDLAGRLKVDDVRWMDLPYWEAFVPGEKEFDAFVGRVLVRPERETEGDVSVPYFRVDQVVVARADTGAADARTLADLRGFDLGASSGRSALRVIDMTVGERPFAYPGLDAARQALADGAVDAILVDHHAAPWLASTDPSFVVVGRVVTGDEFAVVMPTGSKLRACLDEALAEMRRDGTLRKLEREYLPRRNDIPLLPLG